MLVAGGALLLAVGLALGWALPRGGEGGAAVPALSPGPSSSATPSTTSGGSPSAAPTTPVQDVPEACAQAGEAAQEALDAIDEAGDAVADLDARRLDQLIDGLRPLREQLPSDVAACRSAVAASQR